MDSPDSSSQETEENGETANITASVDIPMGTLVPEKEQCRHRDILSSP